MKRFFWFILLLAVVAGAAYLWWQRHSADEFSKQVRAKCAEFVQNSSSLSVSSEPVQIRGLREARVPRVNITGTNVVLKNGPQLAHVNITVKDVDIEGPPFRLTGVSGGSFNVVVSDRDVTAFLRTRGVQLGPVSFSLNGLDVMFAEKPPVTLKLTGKLLMFAQTTISASGKLVPSSQPGQVDFVADPASVKMGGTPLPSALGSAVNMLRNLNPVISTDDVPFIMENMKVKTSAAGTVTLSGDITGVKPQFGF
jgi:hypothetical protein